MSDLSRRLVAEFLGAALLLFIIVGSGIAAERLSTDGTIELLAHAVAVGAGLAALIAFLAPVSGAHFNPSVTIGFWLTKSMSLLVSIAHVAAQILGAVTGAVVANATFGEPAAISVTTRGGVDVLVSEFIVTFVLVLLILGLVRSARSSAVAPAVGA
jgi:glycerol uptake facilitator-like aquaporin